MNYKKEIGLRAPGLNRGFFVALEGLDGAGKSTQSRLLAEALVKRGLNPLEVKEPTGGQWGQKIRAMARQGRDGLSPKEELNYFVQDRAEDLAENIGPALLAGRPVIADRYILSNIAYQSALGLPEGLIRKANDPFPWPDLTVILTTAVKTGLSRIATARESGPDQAFENEEYLTRVKASFDRQHFPGLIRLDGEENPARITERIMAALAERGLIRERPLEIVDSHCHLSMADFERDLPEVLRRAGTSGVRAMLNVGLGPENSRQVIRLSELYPELKPVVGWHPHEADQFSPGGLAELMDLAARPEVRAFGEIGLDFCLMHSGRDEQLNVFESLLEASTSLDLPIVIHSREAFAETLGLLKKYAPRLKQPGVIHCFTRHWTEAQAYLDLGFYLSLPGVITFPKNPDFKDAAARIPADRLLVETDAPYISPAPFRGRRNEPSYLVYHLQALAEIRAISLEEAATITTANAVRLFRL